MSTEEEGGVLRSGGGGVQRFLLIIFFFLYGPWSKSVPTTWSERGVWPCHWLPLDLPLKVIVLLQDTLSVGESLTVLLTGSASNPSLALVLCIGTRGEATFPFCYKTSLLWQGRMICTRRECFMHRSRWGDLLRNMWWHPESSFVLLRGTLSSQGMCRAAAVNRAWNSMTQHWAARCFFWVCWTLNFSDCQDC